jgi:hypothetical protein
MTVAAPEGVRRVFLISPASCGGRRAQRVLGAGGRFELAQALRSAAGAELGDVFSFMSGLYFRGKLRYARAFGRPPGGLPGVLVITAGHGLQPPETRITVDVLRQYARVRIDLADERYAGPLERDARGLMDSIAATPACEVVLLGSVASDKYVGLLAGIFGPRLLFPADFVGRGDMSRGGLLLRSAEAGRELGYVPVAGAARHGPRPPRLAPVSRTKHPS